MRVIARGFQDEPRKVLAVPCSATHVHLTDEEGNPLIGFPRAYIYEFEERRFQDLEAAYHLGHKDDLTRLWKETPRASVNLASGSPPQ